MSTQSRYLKLLFVLSAAVAALAGGLAFYFQRVGQDDGTTAGGRSAARGSAVRYQPPSSDGYVGSDACVDCHLEISEHYAAHPMALSTRTIDAAQVVEDFDAKIAEFGAFGRNYEVKKVDGTWIHAEELRSSAGKLVYRQQEKLAYGIGAGLKGRSYLLQRDGWLYESPITWYTEKHYWGLSPGYDFAGHHRFDRVVNDSCLFCHTGQVRYESRSNIRLQNPPFAETAIGCERCHGPGKEHVDLMETLGEQNPPAGDYRVVNPQKLVPNSRDSVCYQCHLEGKTRILRNGREFFDFRPGQDIEEVWTVFVSEEEGSLFTGQPEQMVSSTCYRKSNGRLGCTSCHDPHRKPAVDERAAFYRTRCLTCHKEPDCSESIDVRRAQEDSCIACHMPKRNTVDVAHATVSDHRIFRRPKPAAGESSRTRHRWVRFADFALPPHEERRAEVLARYQQASEASDFALAKQVQSELESLAAADSRDFTVCSALTKLYLLQSDFARARMWAERALQERPDHVPTLAILGICCYRLDADADSLEYYRRLFQINPFYVAAIGPYADLLRLHGRLEEAERIAKRGVSLSPTDVMLRTVLADIYLAAGKSEQAQRELEQQQTIRQQLKSSAGR